MWFIVLLLFQFTFLDAGASINLTYILKREKTNLKPSCIAEERERYAAVGWVYPMPIVGAGIPNITTKYIPTITNGYNCKFSKHDLCNLRWAVRDWQIDESSSRTREFLEDSRWEDLPTILTSNYTKEFENRIHLENALKSGFSVRASGDVELFICTGWNPHNYPCYYFNIEKRDIFFTKYAILPNELDYQNSYLEHYKAFSNILSDDEWRNFEVNMDGKGVITLVDKNLNRTVIEHTDSEPLKPMYLLMRSNEPSLWKISENMFMFTTTAQISRVGPQLQIPFKDLCISMFVSTCNNCEMTFFYMNGTSRKILKYVGSTNHEWVDIKLKEENIQIGKLNIFVETKFIDGSLNQSEGWWSYDDVRVCNENEVKVTFLKINETFAEDDLTVDIISCQLIKKPSWRPTKLLYDEITDFPDVITTTNETSVKLEWKQEDPDNYINYFIFYQGNDLCASETANSKRVKSNGFLSTKHNEIIIKNLVPYTVYNITISSVLHEHDKILRVNTLETEEPTFEELPFKMHIRPFDTAVNVSWEKPNCFSRYGRLIYNLIVSNKKLKFNKTVELKTENLHLIDGLLPYTTYSLTVLTSRNARNLIRGVDTASMSYNFTTLAGVAAAVKNLEMYAIGENAAYLRYELPSHPQGIPTEVQVTRCNRLSSAKCRPSFSKIERCKLFRGMFCIDIHYLIPHQPYIFKVSIKNTNTNAYGKEMEVSGDAIERVPTSPQNITYQIVDCQETTDYCHLNISWLHPWFPNGTITSFNIILNSTYFNSSYSEEDQTIHEVYKIINDAYLPRYSYQVKYVPYSTEYNLYLQSANSKYKSEFTTTIVKTANLGDHIDQSPKLLGKGDRALVFKLPHLDRRLDLYTLTVAVQDYNTSVPISQESFKNQKIADNLCHSFGETWVSQVLKVKDNNTKTVTITSLDETRAIKPETKYCIIFIITNKYRGEDHDVVYYEKLQTPSEPDPIQETSPVSYEHLYGLLLLLLLIPIGYLVYRCILKRNISTKQREPMENEYETLPFEEHEGNFANNKTYDQLIHK